MQTKLHAIIIATQLGLVAGLHSSTRSFGDQLQVSIEVAVNRAEGVSRTPCEFDGQAQEAAEEWWITFARAQFHLEKRWEAVNSQVGCGAGALPEGLSEGGLEADSTYLIARISTFAGMLPTMLIPERVVVLDVSLSLQKLAGFGTQGNPVYQRSEEKRKYYFLDGGEAFLPLLVADNVEKEGLGVHEVFLRVAAGRVGDETAAAYGVVRVTSGTAEAELLLDGGVVGKIAAGTETELANIPAGLRLVGIRDASGREKWEPVRVEAGRTVLVDLSVPDPQAGRIPYRLEALGKNSQGYEEYRRGSDDAVVVKIPGGEFLMGNTETEGSPLEHRAYVSEFLIDKKGVTWAQYKKYAEVVGISLPPRDPYWGIHDDHPVVFVTWEEAKGYCEWAGARLPTEAEREKAARGTDHRKYPWGNEEAAPDLGVFRSEWGYEATAPVGAHPAGASPYGLLDMGGNVWEWCSDWYDRDYFEVSPYRDPKGPASGTSHVLKGGSWDSRPSVLSCSARNFGHRGYRELDFGFRCAMNALE
jgi:formylglycine-generating enzyme required for sulfatase activity